MYGGLELGPVSTIIMATMTRPLFMILCLYVSQSVVTRYPHSWWQHPLCWWSYSWQTAPCAWPPCTRGPATSPQVGAGQGEGSLSMSAANLDSSAIIILSGLTCVQNKIYGLAKITYNFVSEVVDLKSSLIEFIKSIFWAFLNTFLNFSDISWFQSFVG